MFVSCFYFFYSYFVYLHFFYFYLFIYFVSSGYPWPSDTVKSPISLNLVHVLIFVRNFYLFIKGWMRERMMGWMMTNDRTNGWKGRPNTTASEQNQGYYISRLVGTRDLRTLWSPPKVSGGAKGGGQARYRSMITVVYFISAFITSFGTIFLRKVATFFYGKSPLWLQTKNLRKIK